MKRAMTAPPATSTESAIQSRGLRRGGGRSGAGISGPSSWGRAVTAVAWIDPGTTLADLSAICGSAGGDGMIALNSIHCNGARTGILRDAGRFPRRLAVKRGHMYAEQGPTGWPFIAFSASTVSFRHGFAAGRRHGGGGLSDGAASSREKKLRILSTRSVRVTRMRSRAAA